MTTNFCYVKYSIRKISISFFSVLSQVHKTTGYGELSGARWSADPVDRIDRAE